MSDEMSTESTAVKDEQRRDTAKELTAATFSQLVRDHQNAYIRVADNKASILLSGLVAYLGISLGVIGTNLRTEGTLFLIVAAASVLSTIIAIYYAASAVYPNTPPTPQGLFMWESIVEESEKEYRKTIRLKSSDELLKELIDENYQLAKVNDAKYQQIQRALQATIPTVTFGILMMILLVSS